MGSRPTSVPRTRGVGNRTGGRLEALPGWSWHTFESEWDRGLSHLRRHLDEEGDADVPQGFVSADDYHLGRWISKQRTKYAQGRLTEGQVRELSSIPGWTWSVLSEAWETGFQKLVRYTEVHGHALVPTDYRDDDGFPLGRWGHNQVTWRAKGKMPRTREARLEALPGWDWGGIHAARWEQGFSRLAEYAAAEGTARVPVSWRDPSDRFALGMWTANQRSWFARGKMPQDRAARLEALPGWVWDARDPSKREIDP